MANEKVISVKALIELFQYALANLWGYIWGAAGIEWTKARQTQKVNYMVSKYGAGWKTSAAAKEDNYYGAALYGSKWIGHTVADCSGLFVWAFKKLGGAIAHGSNSIYDRYCSAKGKLSGGARTDGQGLKPGTAVFVYKAAKKNRSHIGLYVGDGVVIEASGTKVGVITSKITDKKWAEWGELKAVNYDGVDPDPKPEPKPDEKPTLRKGSKGEYVTLAQTMLIQKGYDLGHWGADGSFGAQTEKAVKEFQTDHELKADGIIGPATWAALEKQGTNLYTVTIQHVPKFKAEALLKQFDGCTTMVEEGR